jgi:glycerol-3-phosphate acyltransferase PlsX
MKKIAFDMFGGDHAPEPQIIAVTKYLKDHPEAFITMVGDQEILTGRVPSELSNQFEIIHASDVIGMDEPFSKRILARTQSSMAVTIDQVATGKADGAGSCGNTAGLVAFASTRLQRLSTPNGKISPALATTFPSLNRRSLVLDLGARPDCSDMDLYYLALMGKVHAEKILDRPKPTVALLSNGSEDSKGNELTKAAFKLLVGYPFFAGNAEPEDVLTGKFDVIVASGFDGNLGLKWIEATTKFLLTQMKGMATTESQIELLKAINKQIGYEANNGAVLLGLLGIFLKGHGKSDAEACYSLIEAAFRAIENDVNSAIMAEFNKYPLK